MEKLKSPKRRENSPVITWEQSQFEAVYKDVPASEIPNSAVAYIRNLILYGPYMEVRPGTSLWSDQNIPSPDETDAIISGGGRPISALPSPTGRDNYVLSKDGKTVTRQSGQEFTVNDILSWILWPDGLRDLIVGWIDGDNVQVFQDTVHAASTEENPARLQRPMNCTPHWHNESRKLFFFIGEEVYYTDYLVSNFIKVPILGAYPYNAKSTFDENKGFVYLFNYNGIFQIDTLTTPIEMYKINDEVLKNEIVNIEGNDVRNIGRRYLYCGVRLGGTGNRNRGSEGAVLKKETGSNKVDKANQYNDYKEIYYQSQLEDSTGEVYTEVVGVTPTNDIHDFTALDDAAFDMDINGLGPREIRTDLTNSNSFDDVAQAIEDQLNIVYSDSPVACQCRWDNDNQLFRINGGTRNGNFAGTAGAPAGGTDISGAGYLAMTLALATLENIPSSHVVGSDVEEAFRLPTLYTWMTHYSVYCTRNVNDEAINPEQYSWNEDVPVAKALTASVTALGIINVSDGELELMDVGCKLRFENGVEYFIRVVNGPTEGRVNYIGGPAVEPVEEQACAIGGGRVMRATQYEDEVYTESEDFFEPDDLERPIFWADGTVSIVKRYLSNRKVKVWNGGEKPWQAITIEPIGRNFNDILTDNQLLYRAKEFPLRNRFWTAMPSYGLGAVVHGFMFEAPINGREIAYCQMPIGFEYLSGHHYAPYQIEPVKDAIRKISEYPDRLVIYCTNSTRKIVTSDIREAKTPEVGELIAVITGVTIIDPDIGIKDRGGVRPIEGGREIVVTSEPGVRIFDGFKYSQNLLIDPDGKSFILKDIQRLQLQLASLYEPKLGYVFWGSDKAGVV